MKNHSYKVKGLVAALALAGLAGVATAGPVNDAMLLSDRWCILAAHQRQLGRLALQHAEPDQRQQRQAAEGRLDHVSPGGKTDAQNTPAVHDGMVYFAAGQQGVRAGRRQRPGGLEVRAQAAGRLGRVQRPVRHRQAPRPGDLRRTTCTSCPTTPSCTPSTTKTGKANVRERPIDGLPATRRTSPRPRTRTATRSPSARWPSRRHHHRADERHGLRRAARLRAGRQYQRRGT